MSTSHPLNIALLGAGGKMGKIIISLIEQNPDFNLVLALEHPSFKDLGKNINIQSNIPPEVSYSSIQDLEAFLTRMNVDVCIDFSHPDCTTIWAPIILSKKVPIVIATTGLRDQFVSEIQKLATLYKTSALISTNMAFGMNLFIKIAKEIASFIPNWDIEIIEKHHHLKIDSPSGTALTLANEIRKIIAEEFSSEEILTFGRAKGRYPRKIGNKEIGIHAVRAGDIVGEHTILFAGPGERIEFTHQAHSRTCFGEGALNAAKFLYMMKNNGTVYNITDLIEFTGRH